MGDNAKKKKTKGDKNAEKSAAKHAEKSSKAPDAASIIADARAAAFTDEDPQRSFDHFRPLAEKVPTAALALFTNQPLILRANIRTALSIIEPHLARAVGALREPNLKEIFELPALVMGLEYAAGRVPVAKLSNKEIEKMLAEGAPWRELMLSYLEIASHPLLGLLPRERVAAVRAGTGKLDQAQDFVAAPGLFTEFAAVLEGKHPFPPDALDRLATLGGTLVKQIRPGNAMAEVAKRSPESILRDQFAALVIERYDRLEVLGAVALGSRKANELLPALRSSTAASRVADAVASAPDAGSTADK